MERFEKFDHIPKPGENSYITFLSQKVWQLGISQPQGPKLKDIGQETIQSFVVKALERMRELEVAAEKPLLDRITEDDAKMNAIWCPSAPGSWSRPWKNDRYSHRPYSLWWDRTQMIESIRIALALGRLKVGCSTRGEISKEFQEGAQAQSPKIIYNGRTEDENNVLREAIVEGGYRAAILRNNLYIIDTNLGKRFSSLDQVSNLRLPERNLQSGDSIGIVIRPGQAVRLLHFLNEPRNGFPEGVRVKIFPVKTGSEGLPYHHIQEACGLLYYRFTTGDAAENPYPYEL